MAATKMLINVALLIVSSKCIDIRVDADCN
jgi:hypothetical protein